MPEENDEKKTDAVSLEEHNKIVGAANTAKAENDELKKKLDELEKKNQEFQTEKKTEEDKKEWEKVREDTNKQIEDLKKQIEENKSTNKVAKGIVTNLQQEEQTNPSQIDEKLMGEVRKFLPEPKVNPKSFASNWARFEHYANPKTREYTDEQIGMALSLHAGVNKTTPSIIGGHHSDRAHSIGNTDLVLRQKPIN